MSEIIHWPDIQFAAKPVSADDNSVEWRVVKLVIVNDGYLYDFDPPKGSVDNTTADFEKAEVFLKGHVKWDGCSNWDFGDYMKHFCSVQEAFNVGVLLSRLYDESAEMMVLTWDDDLPATKDMVWPITGETAHELLRLHKMPSSDRR